MPLIIIAMVAPWQRRAVERLQSRVLLGFREGVRKAPAALSLSMFVVVIFLTQTIHVVITVTILCVFLYIFLIMDSQRVFLVSLFLTWSFLSFASWDVVSLKGPVSAPTKSLPIHSF